MSIYSNLSFAVVAAGLSMFLAPSHASAQDATRTIGTVEAGGSAAALDHGYGDWSSGYARGAFQVDPATVLFPEIVVSREFHDSGTLFGLGATRTLSETWYAFAAVSTSAGGFYLPRLRATAVLNHKLLASRRLVVNAGASVFSSKDTHRDVAISAGGVYYFTAPWILEGGTSWNSSSPGSVHSQTYFAAATQGRAGAHYWILRAGAGREAYQLIAPGNAVADFRSNVVSLTWRKWVTRSGGAVVAAERYDNPYYRRTGISLGGFWTIR